jgi:hypothetical protein
VTTAFVQVDRNTLTTDILAQRRRHVRHPLRDPSTAQVARLHAGRDPRPRAGNRLIGIVAGIAGALAVSRLLQQTLFDVDAANPLIYLALSVFLLLVAECASWFPAQRATRIDPVIALRTE